MRHFLEKVVMPGELISSARALRSVEGPNRFPRAEPLASDGVIGGTLQQGKRTTKFQFSCQRVSAVVHRCRAARARGVDGVVVAAETGENFWLEQRTEGLISLRNFTRPVGLRKTRQEISKRFHRQAIENSEIVPDRSKHIPVNAWHAACGTRFHAKFARQSMPAHPPPHLRATTLGVGVDLLQNHVSVCHGLVDLFVFCPVGEVVAMAAALVALKLSSSMVRNG